jgi:hypothetical protein
MEATKRNYSVNSYQQRREQVYAILSQAPAGATYSQLVEFVKEQTGKGCSRKLISQWKRESGRGDKSTDERGQVYEPVDKSMDERGQVHGQVEKSMDMSGQVYEPVDKSMDERGRVRGRVEKSMDMSGQVDGQVDKSMDERGRVPGRVDKFMDERGQVCGRADGREQTSANTKPITLTPTDPPNTLSQPIKLNLLSGFSRFIATLLLSCSILLGLSFVTPERPEKVTAQNPSPTVPPRPRRESNEEPRKIKIHLTLVSPSDLKVKEEQEITAGQILSDRSSERTRLLNQRQQLELSLQKLDIPLPSLQTPARIAGLRPLPITSFKAEQAEIALKQQELKSTEKRIKNQESKIKELQSLENNTNSNSSPNNPNISIIIEHETAILSELKQEKLKAIKNLEIAKSRLISAKESRQQAEYNHYLEATQRAIALQNQQIELERQRTIRAGQLQEREYSKAAVQAKIQEIDNAISQLSSVKAPYSGKIRRIKWEGQSDHQISVELTLDRQEARK